MTQIEEFHHPLRCRCGAGVGKIGIVDYDEVEVTNLHRQILHRETSVGMPKVDSIKHELGTLNSNIQVDTHKVQLNSQNALDIIAPYDVVVDCTDNVATRYLLNDSCVIAKKPLVSGSAIQFEGQLTVYNYENGPCYRCLFPVPPPPDTVMNCGDGGVIGAVTGVIGSLQALEVIKIVLGMDDVLSGKLILFDGAATRFRNVKLRSKKTDCDICSTDPKIKELIDYEFFCKMAATDKGRQLSLLTPDERITVECYKNLIDKRTPHILIDVRGKNEFEICQLENSINVDIKDLLKNKGIEDVQVSDLPVYVVCRRGNDSQLAVKHLKSVGKQTVKDIVGGLHAWAREIDPLFPVY